ncbi:MAG: hypothetical protein QW244_02785 [Candidatus Pacearchaeota archaeon]
MTSKTLLTVLVIIVLLLAITSLVVNIVQPQVKFLEIKESESTGNLMLGIGKPTTTNDHASVRFVIAK